MPFMVFDIRFGRAMLLRSKYTCPLFGRVRKIAESDCHVCLSIRLSVRMKQLVSQWTDFEEILYLICFRISVEKIQCLLKSGRMRGTLLAMAGVQNHRLSQQTGVQQKTFTVLSLTQRATK